MAAIDSLLKLLTAQNGDVLVLCSGKAPLMRKGDQSFPFSMPPLQHATVLSLLQGVVEAQQLEAFAREQVLEASYEADGNAYSVHAQRQGESLVLELRRGASKRPSATATAAPASPPASLGRGRELGSRSALSRLLDLAASQRASDVILSSGADARIRVGGSLREVPDSTCSEEELLELLALTPAQRRSLEESGSADLALARDESGGQQRFRVNLFRQQRGLAAVLRPIRDDIPTLRQLSLPDDLVDLVSYPDGLVLLTGPTGSGKSTTLVALIEHVNQTLPRHIVTLENPIEYVYSSKRALIHQREVGLQVESFSSGLRAALRESPDVILLGEMRDHATISAALTAAETGHLVISTLHSGSAATAIDRIVDVFPAHQQGQVRSQLANILRAVLTQFLVPSTTPPRMLPVLEKMIVNHAVAAKIREDRCHQLATEIQTGRAEGMLSLEQSLAALVRSRQVELNVARACARDPQGLEALVRGH